MTARDEAAAVVNDMLHAHRFTPGGDLVDAIPADVLARLAIERGGLTQAGLSDTAKAVGLYRVVSA